MRHSRLRRFHAISICLVLAGALTTLIVNDPGGRTFRARPRAAGAVSLQTPGAGLPGVRTPKGAAPSRLLTFEGGRTSIATSAGSPARFRDLFPAQWSASIDPAVPATNYWALLIGINDYAGGTRDNVGSYQDARDLRRYLLHLGWHSDHIVLLSNRNATSSMILQGIRWLASKTDRASVVSFTYAGHEEPRYYGGARHIMLHAADNRLILDTTIAREIGRVRAAKMWINLAVCRAGGFNDPGLAKAGRVITFSSPERELSYEDPLVHHSVFGWYLIMEGMIDRQGDVNTDGDVTVEEAFRYARTRVTERTGGRQHPFMIDQLSGNLSLIPPQPAPPPPPPDSGSSDCSFIVCGGTQSSRFD